MAVVNQIAAIIRTSIQMQVLTQPDIAVTRDACVFALLISGFIRMNAERHIDPMIAEMD